MINPRFLLFIQWTCVLIYAKFGYNAHGEAEAHWARGFYMSNQAIVVGWLYLFYHVRIYKYDESIRRAAFWFNVFLLMVWSEHYIPIWHDIIKYSGIFIPIAGYIALYHSITYLINFRKNK